MSESLTKHFRHIRINIHVCFFVFKNAEFKLYMAARRLSAHHNNQTERQFFKTVSEKSIAPEKQTKNKQTQTKTNKQLDINL